MAELRRRYVPPRQDSIEVMPGEEPFAATAEGRRASPGSQALLRRIGEQAQERTVLAEARFEKSELGLIPAEGEDEKARRRQHLIRQAAKHGVPQNVLAQQMQVEGLQPEGPAVETPYGKLPADIAFRYLPAEAKPEKKPTRLTDTKALKGDMKQDYESFDAGKTWKAWGEPYSAKKGVGVGKGKGRPKTAEYNLVNKSIVNNILAGTDIEAGGIFDAVSGTVNEGILRQRLKEGGYEDHYKAYLKIKQLSQRALRDTELVPEDTVAYAFKAAGAEHLLTGEVAEPGATRIPGGTVMGSELVEYGGGKQGYEVKDATGEVVGYGRVR